MHEYWSAFGVDLHLELDAPGGRRDVLERALRDAIRAGRLPLGTRLPSTRALAAELDVARGTVSAAYDQLVAEGYLQARVGSGTVVAELPEVGPDVPPFEAEPVPPKHDLRPGQPDVTTFPTTAWLRSTRRALTGAPAAVYGYGDPRGHLELRTALAAYLGRARGVRVTPAQIVITSGYVQALALLATVVGGSRAIAMENPGLPFHRDVVRHAGTRVVPLDVDELGARTDRLGTAGQPDVGAVVLTPAHQYPMGMTLAPQRRHAAVDWARDHDGVIIEDDYDGEFRYDRQPVGALQGMAPDHVVFVGTASKTLGPALRLAWMVLPDRLVESVVEAKRHVDIHSETTTQLTLADLIAGHAYDRHVRSCRLRYRRRRDVMVERLGRDVALSGIAAGLQALVRLPSQGPTEQEVLNRATAYGLGLGELGSHWHESGDHEQGLIVGYGAPTNSAYPAALDALAHTFRATGVLSK